MYDPGQKKFNGNEQTEAVTLTFGKHYFWKTFDGTFIFFSHLVVSASGYTAVLGVKDDGKGGLSVKAACDVLFSFTCQRGRVHSIRETKELRDSSEIYCLVSSYFLVSLYRLLSSRRLTCLNLLVTLPDQAELPYLNSSSPLCCTGTAGHSGLPVSLSCGSVFQSAGRFPCRVRSCSQGEEHGGTPGKAVKGRGRPCPSL